MFNEIKRWLYGIITGSGILIRLLPILRPFMVIAKMNSATQSNHTITDAGGSTLPAIKFNGKLYPAFGVDNFVRLKNLTIRKDDVLLCGYPKSGCHWVHEILHMLVTGKLEMTKYGKATGGMIELMPEILLDSLPSPRVLNSHVHYEELPSQIRPMKTKIMWTARSPKDTVVSFYNHTQALAELYQYDGSFNDFFKLFMTGDIEYGSYFDYVLAWEHAMKSQEDNDIFVVEYENLKNNTFGIVKDMAEFLGISVTDEFARDVAEATEFSRMKAKRPGNKLFRKGQIGDWHNWLTPDQNAQIDRMWRHRMSNCFYQPQL